MCVFIYQEREALFRTEPLMSLKHNPRMEYSVTLSNVPGRSWQLAYKAKESWYFRSKRTKAL